MQVLITPNLMGLIMLNGFILKRDDIPPYYVWIYWINPLNYAFRVCMSWSCAAAAQLLDCDGPRWWRGWRGLFLKAIIVKSTTYSIFDLWNVDLL